MTRHAVNVVYLGEVADSFRQGRWVQPLPQLHPLNGSGPQSILFLAKYAPTLHM